LMTLRDGVASGWKGIVPGGDATVIESIAFEIDSDPVVHNAVEFSSAARGRPLQTPANEHLWSALQLQAPAELIAVAAHLGSRPVAVVLAFSDSPEDDDVLSAVEELANGLSRNFERLLRAAER
ncbi:MAG: hypothetical protein KJO07_20530, partial [Deltaproteobacteria bacterium]|nr:hypothetical protein [Deltaproteobacteria bacterium]